MRKQILIIIFCFLSFPSFSTEKHKARLSQPDPTWMRQAGISLAVYPYEPGDFALISPRVNIFKRLLYDQYTLADIYDFRGAERSFQWDKISEAISYIESLQETSPRWAVIQNYKNKNGRAPYTHNATTNEYKQTSDAYGVGRHQSIPLYFESDTVIPERYGRDGALVKILEERDSSDFVKIKNINIEGEWIVPAKYIRHLADTVLFRKLIFVDRKNQNITTMEKDGVIWYVRSMNPATTGIHAPPYKQETPLGIFVLQEKKDKMWYLVDGTNEIAGFAAYANRFTNGAYVHGVATNNPETKIPPEFSWSLGTTPRSHMCVRNATSHALFIKEWAPTLASLVVVIE